MYLFILERLVRDPRANYKQSLNVLKFVKSNKQNLVTKTSVMLGLGETDDQIMRVMEGTVNSYTLTILEISMLHTCTLNLKDIKGWQKNFVICKLCCILIFIRFTED